VAYSVNSKKIKSLLKKGTLTGFEVATIVMVFLYDLKHESDPELYESEGVRKPFLSQAEITTIKNNNLKENAKIEEYNNWILALPAVFTAIEHSHIMFLKILQILQGSQTLLESYLIEAVITWDMQMSPGIMTEKQFQELQVQQREEKLKDLYPLDYLISVAAWNLATKAVREELDPDDITEESHPGLYRKGKTQILKFIRTDRLKISKKKDKGKAEALLAKKKPLNATNKRFLDKKLISAEACYEAGLPGWEYIDLYEPNYSEEYGGPGGVAIIQDPHPYRVDANGYYKLHESLLDDRMLRVSDCTTWGRIKVTPRTFFTNILLRVKDMIASFLFYRSVIKVFSEATSINFREHPDAWYEDIQHTLSLFQDTFSKVTTVSDRFRGSLIDIPVIIDLKELLISQELEEKFRKRLSEFLDGCKWLMACQVFFLEEMIEKEESLFIT